MENGECLNCCNPIDEECSISELVVNQSTIQSVNEDQKVHKIIQVEDALTLIFKLKSTSQISGNQNNGSTTLSKSRSVCLTCGYMLTKLYEMHLEFNHLCHVDSYLAKQLRTTDLLVEDLNQNQIQQCVEIVLDDTNKITWNDNASRVSIRSIDPLGPGPWVKLFRLTPDQLPEQPSMEIVDNNLNTNFPASPLSIMEDFNDSLMDVASASDDDSSSKKGEQLTSESPKPKSNSTSKRRPNWNRHKQKTNWSRKKFTRSSESALQHKKKVQDYKQHQQQKKLKLLRKQEKQQEKKEAVENRKTRKESERLKKVQAEKKRIDNNQITEFTSYMKNPSVPSCFKCSICEADNKSHACNDAHQLIEHLLATHLNQDSNDEDISTVQTCPCCSLKLESLYMKLHLKREHVKKMQHCSICDAKIFNFNYSKIQRHIQAHFEESREKFDASAGFLCEYCDKIFYFPSLLHNHCSRDHGKVAKIKPKSPTFPCLHCPEKLRSPSEFRNHYTEQHPGIYPYPCRHVEEESGDICGEFFFFQTSRDAHEPIHLIKKVAPTYQTTSNKCPTCKKVIDDILELSIHIENCQKPFFHCDVCGSKFSTKHYLASHMRRHSKDPVRLAQSKCNICEQQLSSPVCLKIHMMQHSNEKPFVCQECGYSTPLRARLRKHTNVVHLKLRPHLCAQCGKAFASARGLNRHHEKIHVAIRSWKCELDPENCSKAFKDREALKSHERIHREKNLCVHCGFTCSTNQSLKHHLLKRHPDSDTNVMGAK